MFLDDLLSAEENPPNASFQVRHRGLSPYWHRSPTR